MPYHAPCKNIMAVPAHDSDFISAWMTALHDSYAICTHVLCISQFHTSIPFLLDSTLDSILPRSTCWHSCLHCSEIDMGNCCKLLICVPFNMQSVHGMLEAEGSLTCASMCHRHVVRGCYCLISSSMYVVQSSYLGPLTTQIFHTASGLLWPQNPVSPVLRQASLWHSSCRLPLLSSSMSGWPASM